MTENVLNAFRDTCRAPAEVASHNHDRRHVGWFRVRKGLVVRRAVEAEMKMRFDTRDSGTVGALWREKRNIMARSIEPGVSAEAARTTPEEE